MGVFLTDFGLAKSVVTGSRLTRSGDAVGTPHYMAPEQARGEVSSLTPACDTWALGCVGYELLSGGRLAFDGPTPAAVVGAVVTATPPPLDGVPGPARQFVQVCLDKSAAGRYPTAAALRDDLQRILDGQRPLARAAAAPHWPRRLALGAVAAGALAAGAIWWATRTPPGLDPTPGSTAPDPAEVGWRLRQSDLARATALLETALRGDQTRHDVRVRLGLLRWAAGEDLATVTGTWAAVPPEHTARGHAQWLIGLAVMARGMELHDQSRNDEIDEAWRAASVGGGPEARWATAGLALLRGDLAAARAQLDTADADWSAHLLRGLVESSALQMQDAQVDVAAGTAAYTAALGSGVIMAWVYTHRGMLRRRQGDLEGARADLDHALRLAPRYAPGYFNRGMIRQEARDHAGAEADYTRAIELHPTLHIGFRARGFVRRQLGDLAGAEADFNRAIELRPDYTQGYVSRGEMFHVQQRWREAVADYDAAIVRDPDHLRVGFLRAEALQRLGDVAGAAAELSRLVQRHPTNTDALIRRGLLKGETGDPRGCIADLDRALELAPGLANAHCNRGVMRVRLDDLDGAQADYQAAIAADPDYADAYVNRAALFTQLERFDAARADLDTALRLQPTLAEAWFNRGNLHWKAGDLAAAADDYAAAVKHAPSLAAGWHALGSACINLKRWADAIDALRRVVELEPDSPRAATARQWIAHAERRR